VHPIILSDFVRIIKLFWKMNVNLYVHDFLVIRASYPQHIKHWNCKQKVV